MSKWFFLFMAVLYGALLWACILTGKGSGEYPNIMFTLMVGIFSIMHLIEKRAA